jgi:hypothetical protein
MTIEEDVGWLQVTVYDSLLVANGNSGQHLVEESFDFEAIQSLVS